MVTEIGLGTRPAGSSAHSLHPEQNMNCRPHGLPTQLQGTLRACLSHSVTLTMSRQRRNYICFWKILESPRQDQDLKPSEL